MAALVILLAGACGSSTAGPDAGAPGDGGDDSDGGEDGGGDVVPRGTRRLGIEVDEPDGFDHGVQLARAMEIGSSHVQITFPWRVLAPTSTTRDLDFLTFALGYYRERGASVLLSVPTIDTIEKMFPSDLAAMAMDDPAVISALEDLLDDVLAIAGDELTHLVIGNEVNVYLGGRPQAEWDDYQALIAAATTHLAAARPSLHVGLSVTFGGLPDARLTQLTAATETRFVTYYYIGNEFGGTPADNVADDLATMIEYAGDKPLALKEYGYPTGAATGGSEAGQQQFIAETFAAWDQHADQLSLIMFSIMFDRSRTYCEETATYYGFPGDESFIQFLCTLGLRTFDDQAKPGWNELAAKAAQRSF